MGTMASDMTKSFLTIFCSPISTQKPDLRERIGLVQLGSRTQLLAGAGNVRIRPTDLSPVQNQGAHARRNWCWQARRADAQSEEHNIKEETSYTQRSSAQLWAGLPSVCSHGLAASLTSLGLCLASPRTLCAVSRQILFLIHLDVLPSFPRPTHTLPPAQCMARPFGK